MTRSDFPDRRRSDLRRQQLHQKPRLESLIREAHIILTNCGVVMSPRKVNRLAQTYKARVEANGWEFFDFLANAVQLDEQRRRAAEADIDLVQLLGHRDPTATRAVARVMAESARRAAR